MKNFIPETELIHELLQSGIITNPTAAEQIISSRNINSHAFGTELEDGLLNTIIQKDISEFEKERIVKKLLQFDTTVDSYTLLLAIKYATPLIPQLLAKMQNPQLIHENNWNPFDYAVKKNNVPAVIELLKDKRFNANTKDIYGHTFLEKACRKKSDEIIKILLGRELTEEEKTKYHYGEPFIRINQSVLNSQLQKYLDFNHRQSSFEVKVNNGKMVETISRDKEGNPLSFVNKEGQCGGWAFLHQVYTSANREDEFYTILNLISQWDPTQKPELPRVLAKNYKSVDDVLEQTLNDLVIYQRSRYPYQSSDDLLLAAQDRPNQFNLTKNLSDKRELVELLKFREELNFEQQIEIINLLKSFPNTNIDISFRTNATGPDGHGVSLCIEEKEGFKYYDSNIDYKIPPLTSAEELASLIKEHSYKPFSRQRPLDKIDMTFVAYKFVEPNKPYDNFASQTIIKPEKSTLGFTPLHYAVFENKQNAIAKILENDGWILKDIFGLSPLHYAFNLRNYSCMDEIFKHVETKELTRFIGNNLNWSSENIIKYAFENHLDKLDLSQFTRTGMVYNDWLLPYLTENNINNTDAAGKNALHHAIINEDIYLIEKLIEKGASWNSFDKEGKSAKAYVDELPPSNVKEQINKLIAQSQLSASDKSTRVSYQNLFSRTNKMEDLIKPSKNTSGQSKLGK